MQCLMPFAHQTRAAIMRGNAACARRKRNAWPAEQCLPHTQRLIPRPRPGAQVPGGRRRRKRPGPARLPSLNGKCRQNARAAEICPISGPAQARPQAGPGPTKPARCPAAQAPQRRCPANAPAARPDAPAPVPRRAGPAARRRPGPSRQTCPPGCTPGNWPVNPAAPGVANASPGPAQRQMPARPPVGPAWAARQTRRARRSRQAVAAAGGG